MMQPLFAKGHVHVYGMTICKIIFIHTFREDHYLNSWIYAEMT
jgi:hypothetical protein